MPFLVADCVSKSFGERRVLTSASLRAVRGEVRTLFGRNGIGKSTLMKIAAGWMPADSGIVRVDGVTMLDPSLAALARRGVMFLPDSEILSRSFTLGRQLRFFAERFGGRSVRESAKLANVDSFLLQRPHELSGGELRRAELALALTRRPVCLIADEPFRGIAPVDHDILTALFRMMAAEGCAVVVSGHDVPSLMHACDHVTWCTSGTTYELGPPDAAAGHDAFRREYLGSGYRR